MTRKTLGIELNDKAASDLSGIAKELGIPVTEVLRKGLLFMGLYAELNKSGSGSIILRNHKDKTDRELTM